MTRKEGRKGVSRRAILAGATLAAIDPLLRAKAFAQSSSGGGLGTASSPVKLRMLANESYARQWQTSMVPEFNKAFPHIELTIDGVPYSEHSSVGGVPHLEAIFLFQRNIERMAYSSEDVEHEIHITLVHEAGHFFGLSEEQLEAMGLG